MFDRFDAHRRVQRREVAHKRPFVDSKSYDNGTDRPLPTIGPPLLARGGPGGSDSSGCVRNAMAHRTMGRSVPAQRGPADETGPRNVRCRRVSGLQGWGVRIANGSGVPSLLQFRTFLIVIVL